MGMVVIQPFILVAKLKKTKTEFLRCTGYLNSIKNPIKQDLLLILVLVQQQIFLKLLPSCLTAVKKHVIKYCEKVYERSGKIFFGLIIPTQCFYRFSEILIGPLAKLNCFLHFDKSPCVGIFDNCLDITVVDCVN